LQQNITMSGVYIHIPFCRQKCHYCNFFSVASVKYRQVFVDALLHELEFRHNYLENKHINTVYFGGGTPSLLSVAEIDKIFTAIDKYFDLDTEAEITLESNPDDLTADKLKALHNETPINRLSIGVQSFYDEDLHYLYRIHNSKQARISIENALAIGFNNISIDLIYGIPTLTDEKWKENLKIFFSYPLPHLSSYALTVEPKTALNILIEKQRLEKPEEETIIKHFGILLETTKDHGLLHYEISNFARQGFYSKHNSIYWLGGHYLGLGPSAHSFNGISRQWNISNLKQYTEADKTVKRIWEKELLSPADRFNEYVMNSLRTMWGCDAEHIENIFGKYRRLRFELEIETLVNQGKVFKQSCIYRLTDAGKLFADGIASALFI